MRTFFIYLKENYQEISKIPFKKLVLLVSTMLLLFFTNLLLGGCSDGRLEVPAVSASVSLLASSETKQLTGSISPEPLSTLPSQALTPSIAITKPNTVVHKNNESNWLKGIPCIPPCWEGVTPGKTKAEEALKIFEKSNNLKNVNLSIGNTGFYITWDWLDGSKGGSANSGQMSIFRTPVVEASSLEAIEIIEPEYTTFNLDELVKAYGEPSHIIATFAAKPPTYFDNFYTLIIYLPQGFALLNESSTIPNLNNSLKFEKLKITIPNIDSIISLYPPHIYKKELVLPWRGFQNWKNYCRKLDTQSKINDCANK